jgi:FtsP/CotA-like multicopper oxidase with cupredoxin domain
MTTAGVVLRLVCLLLAALPLAACGGGESGATELSIVGGEVKEDAEVGGFAFEGDHVVSPGPTIRVRAGQEVTITFKNVHGQYFGESFIPHNLVVAATKDQDAKPLWNAAIGETDYVLVGDSGSVTFTAGAPGRYFYLCTVSGHIDRGMWGRFLVEE